MPEAATQTETPTTETTSTTAAETAATAAQTLAAGNDPAGAAAKAEAAATAATAFPATWRDMFANGDDKARKDLDKYTDPAAVYKSLRSLQSDISSGKLKATVAPPAATATDEVKAQWRASQGLPDKAETYVTNIATPDGYVLSDADKPLLGNFAEMAMAKGWTQNQFNDAASWFFQAQDAVEQQRAEGDATYRTTAQTELMSEWGPADYKTNMNAVGTMLAQMDRSIRTVVLAARTPDGRLLGDSPEFLKWAAGYVRETNPAATLISPSEANIPKAIQTEMAQIEAVLAKAQSGDREAHRLYYGAEGQPGLDARWRELFAAQQQIEARKGAA
jgi:hypothetical protein